MIAFSPTPTGPPAGPRAPFIVPGLRPLPAAAGPRLRYALGTLDVALFSTALYGLAGIGLPPHIAHSVPKRQAEFLAGRLCARAALATLGRAACTVGVGAHREPVWPDGVIGSISHNGSYAAAVACPAAVLAGIGIDIESIIGAEARAAMAELVVSAAELDYLRALSGEMGGVLSLDCLLTLVFSAKESFFKAAFAQVRAYFDFDAVRVTEIDTAAGTIGLRCAVTLAQRLREGDHYLAGFELVGKSAVLTVVALPACET